MMKGLTVDQWKFYKLQYEKDEKQYQCVIYGSCQYNDLKLYVRWYSWTGRIVSPILDHTRRRLLMGIQWSPLLPGYWFWPPVKVADMVIMTLLNIIDSDQECRDQLLTIVLKNSDQTWWTWRTDEMDDGQYDLLGIITYSGNLWKQMTIWNINYWWKLLWACEDVKKKKNCYDGVEGCLLPSEEMIAIMTSSSWLSLWKMKASVWKRGNVKLMENNIWETQDNDTMNKRNNIIEMANKY